MILIICNTSYQVFNAINLKMQMHPDEEIDIILSEHTNLQGLEKNLNVCKLFRNVYLAETLTLARQFYFFEDSKKLNALLQPEKYVKDCLDIDYLQYDIIYTANVDGYINLIFRMHLLNQTFCEIRYYEDGWTTYANDWSNFAYSPYEKHFYEVLGQDIFCKALRTIYVYEPKLGCYSDKFEYKQLPKIDINDMKMKTVYNFIFEYNKYKEDIDLYKTNAIFLEEAFLQDGYQNNDLDLILNVAQRVGESHLLVKRHPRLLKNRFESLEIITNSNFSIPWEVIIFNNDFKDKILFTITSGAVLTPRLVFGIPTFSIFMRDLLIGPVSPMYKTKGFQNFINMFRKLNPNEVYIPKTLNGIQICIDTILEEMQTCEWILKKQEIKHED